MEKRCNPFAAMDGMSKAEWRRSMLFNVPDEVALEAKLDRIKAFKEKRLEVGAVFKVALLAPR